MRFSKLRLTGFKSFVDPTDLIIADGLTGVVGPNGCGKSNLLEALRWVMGENRPTAMRGGGMEDVIFAGAATRPARNFAEVALHIDNRERLAPAGFNDTIAWKSSAGSPAMWAAPIRPGQRRARARCSDAVCRCLHRRAFTSLGAAGTDLRTDQRQAKDRRRILEEAAGISGLYQRRHEAELKVERR